MNVLALAFLLAANAPPTTTGGSPSQRQQLDQLAQQVPACLRDASGSPVAMRVEGPGTRREFNAGYQEGSGRRRSAISVYQALFEPYLEAAIQAAAANQCGTEAQFRLAMSPLGILTHEFAHHFHFAGTYVDSQGRRRRNVDLINQFLAIKWRAARQAALNDPEIRRLTREMSRLEAMRPPRNAEEARQRYARLCEVTNALDARYAAHGFPVRYPGDGPYGASDREGGEYFAMAIETLVFNPAAFAAAYSPEEQAWLAANFGECLKTFPNLPPAFRELIERLRAPPARTPGTPQPAQGAGMERS